MLIVLPSDIPLLIGHVVQVVKQTVGVVLTGIDDEEVVMTIKLEHDDMFFNRRHSTCYLIT